MNYYERDKEGIWWINGETTKVKCSFSGTMEIAYQLGKKDGIKESNELKMQNRHS